MCEREEWIEWTLREVCDVKTEEEIRLRKELQEEVWVTTHSKESFEAKSKNKVVEKGRLQF